MLVQDSEEKFFRAEEGGSGLLTIMVQAFGKLEKTKKCVQHILDYAGDIPYQLLLVDNGSPERDVLDFYLSVEHPNKKVVRIEKNESSIKGSNAVIPFIDTKYLLLVANDIYITPNCVENLLRCAESDLRIGMVNSVSTNMGLAQQEDLGGFADEAEMIAKAAAFNKSDPRRWDERILLAPTAVLYRRDIFVRAGLYDPDYPHEFGDADISFRIRRAGYKLMLCRDAFVHHDHLPEDRSAPFFIERSLAGQKIFQEKFYGLDALADTPTIDGEIKKIRREETAGAKRILAIEPACGTALLDIKNYYRRHGIFSVEAHAFSSEAKYYMDLISLTEHVTVDRLAFLAEHYERESFDFVAVCRPLKEFSAPERLWETAAALVKKDGVLLTF